MITQVSSILMLVKVSKVLASTSKLVFKGFKVLKNHIYYRPYLYCFNKSIYLSLILNFKKAYYTNFICQYALF